MADDPDRAAHLPNPSSDPFGLRVRGIRDERVIAAMARVPRESFVLPEAREAAYADSPLAIGFGQTISQPYIVAWMTEMLNVGPDMRVLEVGTGSGYQTAVLAEMGAEVWSLEVVPELAARSARTLAALGYDRVHLRTASGYDGWPEAAPFDRIILTAAPLDVPPALLDQLADGGRLVAPVGTTWDQHMVIIDRHGDELHRHDSIGVQFVVMKKK
jgi:protein-L-isoaspartate(D-aspartate) O-methyltransferase